MLLQDYQIMTGIISELEVFDTQGQFSSAGRDEEAEAYLNSMQYFRCKVGNRLIEGTFCRVFFNNGDQVEVVVDPQHDGSYFAYAVRRPVDHRLWLHPWATTGTKAIRKGALKFSAILVGITYLLIMIVAIVKIDEMMLFLKFAAIGMICCSVIGLLPYFLYKRIIGQGSRVADKIFATLGYPEPKLVDMGREVFKFYSERDEQDPNFYVDITTEQYKQEPPEGTKWVTFYREAPPIPDYITVINTELSDKQDNAS